MTNKGMHFYHKCILPEVQIFLDKTVAGRGLCLIGDRLMLGKIVDWQVKCFNCFVCSELWFLGSRWIYLVLLLITLGFLMCLISVVAYRLMCCG
jgi:hypothetical protein